jgi:hypothetical protein
MRIRTNAFLTLAAAATLLVTGSGVAHAAEPSPAAEFEAAQRTLGLSTEDATAFAAGVDVQTGEENAVTASLGDFSVRVTADATHSDVTVLPDGARVMGLLQEGQRATTFQVDLPPSTTLQPEGDGYRIVTDAGGTSLVLGQIQAPWAVDADGNRVATSYKYSDGVLTQTIHDEDATYPIVADPTLTVGLAGASDGPGVYWNMTGLQAKSIAAVSIALVGTAVAGGCAGASKIPRVGAIAGVVCGAVGYPKLAQVFGAVQSAMKSTKVTNTACYQIKVVPSGTGLKKVGASNCS